MSMIHSLLQDYQLNKDITAFLLELKAKAVTASPYRIDELYAIMPPIEVIWQNTNDTIKLHQLNGILTIQTQWMICKQIFGMLKVIFLLILAMFKAILEIGADSRMGQKRISADDKTDHGKD